MNLYVRNNKFWFELENLTRLFFPNEKINVFKDDSALELPYICAEQGENITVSVRIGGFEAAKSAPVSPDDGENELSMVKLLYVILRDFSGVDQPWGLLTGVRP
ncbi:MAG: coproporphyrinogen dehydrogenase HemZ, partial [Ruminococcus sp.]|nr:coproporphyrinogen dehydrogenase HemZ [Ruminococcus sp.]